MKNIARSLAILAASLGVPHGINVQPKYRPSVLGRRYYRRSRYMPHQGKQEIARRLRQAEKIALRRNPQAEFERQKAEADAIIKRRRCKKSLVYSQYPLLAGLA